MITKTSFIGQFISDINNYYTFTKELGSGAYGNVYRVQNKLTGEIRACKKMNKKKIKNKERFKIEIDLLKATDHQNIVKLYEIFEDQVYLYLIMEECLGGEFFDRLAQRAKTSNLYTEKEAARIFKQLISAINYCHCHGVCHRDIKPENLLFASMEDDSPLKMIDFGLSKIFSAQDHAMKSIVGTTYYMAPEVIKGKYDEKCDIWSAGVILYIMLCGRPPFFGKTDDEIMRRIARKSYTFDYPEFKKISRDALDLVASIFVDAESRPSSQDILDNPWVNELAPNSTEEVLKLDFDHLKEYSNLNKVHKSVISFVSFRLKDEDTRELSKIFKSFDINNDGVLSMKEVQEGFKVLQSNKSVRLGHNELEAIFNNMDLDRNGMINYNEFISAMIDYKSSIKTAQVYEAFRAFDTDNNGKLSYNELAAVIRPQTEEDIAYLKDLFTKFDLNGDGEIDFDEFINGLELEDNKISRAI